jgi:hypothetical protein
VGADQADDGEVPPDEHPDRRDDQDGTGEQAPRPDNSPAETRTRQEYYADLRTTVSREESAAERQVTAEEQAASDKWQEKVTESRELWSKYLSKFPPAERPPVDKSKEAAGWWQGDGKRELEPAENSQVEAACDRIAKLEKDRISPAMRAIESQDPDRHLVGFDRRLKERDRVKEKVYDMIKESGFALEDAVSHMPDANRYTFGYREAHYTQGVWADIERLKGEGFKLHILKNFWSDDQYKGINSQWIEPDTGHRFEVQFHTRISFEAKELTHPAYGRLRTKKADGLEELVLEAFQRKVAAGVPVPPGATDIPDYYPERGTDAR